MGEKIKSLELSSQRDRLDQAHYVPVYDIDNKHIRRTGQFALLDRLVRDYKFKKNFHGNSDTIPSTYVSTREPPPVSKLSLPLLKKFSNPENPTLNEKKLADTRGSACFYGNIPEARLGNKTCKEVDTTSRSPPSMLYLPRIMKSFYPTASRKPTTNSPAQEKSSWIDLTTQRNIKQIAPPYHRRAPPKFKTSTDDVTTFTVKYKNDPNKKLQRRPLPPIKEVFTSEKGKVPSLIPIWLPGFSHTANPQEKKQARHLILPIQDSRSKSFDFLFLRLSQFQSISRPSNRNDLMTNKPKDIRIMKRTGHRLRRESDKQFGINKGGGSLNKLPSDLMGHLQTNFRNLEHYLGRAPFVQKRDEQVVFIPTGHSGELPQSSQSYEQFAQKRTSRVDEKNAAVKMKYAHRESDDTPPLQHFPWELGMEASEPPPQITATNPCNAPHDPAPKQVNHVTIKLPKVPPPSPELALGPPKLQNHKSGSFIETPIEPFQCRLCENDVEKQAGAKLPELAVTYAPINESRDPRYMNKKIGGKNEEYSGVEKKMKKSPLERIEHRSRLVDRLVMAHGELKRRHKCSKKEVVIAPFTVKVENDNRSSEKLPYHQEKRKTVHVSSITKPFTFSYLPLKKPGLKNCFSRLHPQISSVNPRPQIPTVLNPRTTPSKTQINAKKPSIISRFVATNQSHEIYEALIKDPRSRTRPRSTKQPTVTM